MTTSIHASTHASRSVRRAALLVAAAGLLGLAACNVEIGETRPLKQPAFERAEVSSLVGEAGPDFRRIGCQAAGETIRVRRDTALDPACRYEHGAIIDRSGVTLDCRGATIALPKRRKLPGGGRYAVLIRAERDETLSDIRVRNCRIEGGTNNLRITRRGFRDLAPERAYDAGFRNVVIENSRLYDAAGTGLYVDAYVTGVTIRGVEVAGAGGAGIYLEAGSRGSLVEASHIHHNGYADTQTPSEREGFRYLMAGREGIAVDGSRDNVIRGNRIHHNALGGVFLYKNCGEDRSKPNWWPRPFGADRNLVEDNDIRAERTGVWIASRENQNQWLWDCSDPVVHEDSSHMGFFEVEFYDDRAAGNRVVGNRFRTVDFAVRVEDGPAEITGNRVLYDSAGAIERRPAVLVQAGPGPAGRLPPGVRVTANRFEIDGPLPRGEKAKALRPLRIVEPGRAAPSGGPVLSGNLLVGEAGRTVPVDRTAPMDAPPRDPILLVRGIWR